MTKILAVVTTGLLVTSKSNASGKLDRYPVVQVFLVTCFQASWVPRNARRPHQKGGQSLPFPQQNRSLEQALIAENIRCSLSRLRVEAAEKGSAATEGKR